MKITTAICVLAALASAACGGQAASSASARVAITLTDTGLKAEPATAPAGKVTFAVNNAGSTIHSFTVLQTAVAQDKLPADPANAAKAQEAGKVATTGQITAVQTKELSVDLKPGSYVLICNEPGHYLMGMHAAFTVK